MPVKFSVGLCLPAKPPFTVGGILCGELQLQVLLLVLQEERPGRISQQANWADIDTKTSDN